MKTILSIIKSKIAAMKAKHVAATIGNYYEACFTLVLNTIQGTIKKTDEKKLEEFIADINTFTEKHSEFLKGIVTTAKEEFIKGWPKANKQLEILNKKLVPILK